MNVDRDTKIWQISTEETKKSKLSHKKTIFWPNNQNSDKF